MEDKDKNIHELAKENPGKTYNELTKIKEGVCVPGALRKDVRKSWKEEKNDRGPSDLERQIDELKETLKSKDYTRQHDYKFLVEENKKLHKEVDELKRDNKKLAHHIEDRIDRSRKAGM